MKLYVSSGYQNGKGQHHPVVPDGSILAWDGDQIALIPVKRADGTCAQVICLKKTGDVYEGTKDNETYGFSDLKAGTVNASRAHPDSGDPVDTDTGTFTATEIHNPQPPNE